MLLNYSIRVLALIIGCVLLGSCATVRHSKTANIGDSNIIYADLGDGPLTIVLEAGLGDGMEVWESTFKDMSLISRVFAYCRPGYGFSDTTSRHRNMRQIVNDLRGLLKKTGNRPPFILVGHSLGGDYMLYFAEHYPHEVAGLVLVEARHPEFSFMCHDRNISGCDVPSVIYSLWPEHIQREYDAAQKMKLSGKIGNIPLAIISRTPGRGLLESKKFIALWMDTQKSLTQFSTKSKQIIAKDAGHYVQKDEPATVVDGVRWVISQNAGKAIK